MSFIERTLKFLIAITSLVSFVVPAYGWDFSASGSSSAMYKRETTNSGTSGAKDLVTNQYSSSAGGVTALLSHSDGYANSATVSYTADWNGDDNNFDEYVKVSGTKKVGNWTASSSTTQHLQKDSTSNTGAQPMTADATASFTLTDGSITYKFGDATHLSTAEKTSDGPMEATVDAEARVDSFDGFSVGFSIGKGILTLALDENDDQDIFGDRSLIVACGSDNLGFGFSYAGDVGFDLILTYAMGTATADATSCTGDNSTNDASMNTIGVGVAIPFTKMELAFDLEYTALDSKVASNETKETINGIEVSFSMPFGDATTGINISQQESKTISGGIDTARTSTSGTEAWYAIPIGPVGLNIGYGISGVSTGCDTCSATTEVTSTSSQFGAEMTMSF